MDVEVRIVKAFVDGEKGGNPAGVVVDANRLSSSQKQAVAAKVGLSETAFVSASRVATLRLEFFTPTRQIAHCGHATIATFSLLRQLGHLTDGRHSKETTDGTRAIQIDSNLAFMEQRAPTYMSLENNSDALALVIQSLSITKNQLLDGYVPRIVNTGNSFLIVPLDSEQTLSTLRPDFKLIETLSNRFDLIGYYPFTLSTKLPGRIDGTRVFAPR